MSLPVDDIFPALTAELEHNPRVILQAPPGAGKSTRLPLLLLQTGSYHSSNQIIILEPRRVAARQIAHFLASSIGQSIGQQIGLSMRGQHLVSSETVIKVVTDGVMVRQLQQNPELDKVGLIIFDEFHERGLQTDLALALSLDAQELNEQVKLLIMSATLDLAHLSEQLQAPIVESSGRQYPVTIKYCNSALIPSSDEIIKAIQLALAEQTSSILVFLSGVGEINRIQAQLQQQSLDGIQIYPLYGGLSIEQQVQAIEPVAPGLRKVVLATNIAQTSLTIEGIDVVVDSGTERSMNYHVKTGSEQLLTQPISIAAATQRAGRAGRLRPGVCYRLGSKEVFERRRQHDIAEIQRANLAPLLLELSLWGAKFADMFWLTKPDAANLLRAEQELVQLGYWQASATGMKNTDLVQHFERYNAGLRFSKMLALAAELDDQDILQTAVVLSTLLEQTKQYSSANLVAVLEYLSAQDWHRIVTESRAMSQRLGLGKLTRTALDVDALAQLLLWAYPDRVAKKQGKSWKMANGARAQFHSSEAEPKAELIVVAGLNNSEYGSYIQAYAEVELDFIRREFSSLISTESEIQWSQQKQAPQRLQQVKVGHLILAQTPLPLDLNEQDWQQVWCSAVVQQGLSVFGQEQVITEFINKLTLARQFAIQGEYPELSEELLLQQLQQPLTQGDNWLSPYLSQVRKLADLTKLNMAQILSAQLNWQSQQELALLCPDVYQTPAGNKRKISYLTSAPKLAVKLQEMFGEPTSPTVCNGKQALTLELLSPAQRPLQITQDLANFWQNAYVEVKKEMKGRYPKHPWPDDPVNFVATTKTKRHL